MSRKGKTDRETGRKEEDNVSDFEFLLKVNIKARLAIVSSSLVTALVSVLLWLF